MHIMLSRLLTQKQMHTHTHHTHTMHYLIRLQNDEKKNKIKVTKGTNNKKLKQNWRRTLIYVVEI